MFGKMAVAPFWFLPSGLAFPVKLPLRMSVKPGKKARFTLAINPNPELLPIAKIGDWQQLQKTKTKEGVMKAQAIKKLFARKGFVMPEMVRRKISDPEYNQTESWCCGIHVMYLRRQKVIRVMAYCWRLRAGRRIYFVDRDGSYKLYKEIPLDDLISADDIEC
jgi:hypothetical protein